jgi:demethylmenaquinone methyltransferase/2-methoxy-6-polyprenyl-1,4-benzoquinol methylase
VNRKNYFDSLASVWDEITKHNYEKIKEIIELIKFTEGAKVLDIGCGTGVLIPFIIPKIGSNGKLICLDISEKMLEVASRKFPKEHYPNLDFTPEDILNYETKEIFDFIICYSSFPHFIDKERAIGKMASLLNNNGKLIIAHSQSRKEINNFHKSLEGPVSEDYLPSSCELMLTFRNFSLIPSLMIDDEEKYLVIGVKSI